MTSTITRPAQTRDETSTGRRWLRRLRRTAVGALAVVVAGGAMGAGVQGYAAHRDNTRHPAPGQLITVDGHTLHLNVTGTEHAGQGPTIVLESGMGPAFSDAWAWIQRDLEQFAQVVSYDRPGLGWSDPHPHGTDPVALANDLRAALGRAGMEGPYIIVGHSLGAFHARVFAAEHTEDVAGLVLLDPSHEDQWDRFPDSVNDAQPAYNRILQALPVAARFGLTRLFHPMGVIAQDLPVEVQDRVFSRLHQVNHLAATWDERDAFDRLGEVARDGASNLGDLPVTVVSAGIEPDMPEISEPRMQLGKELAASLTSNGTWHVITDADHIGMVSKQPLANQVTPHIEQMWNMVK